MSLLMGALSGAGDAISDIAKRSQENDARLNLAQQTSQMDEAKQLRIQEALNNQNLGNRNTERAYRSGLIHSVADEVKAANPDATPAEINRKITAGLAAKDPSVAEEFVKATDFSKQDYYASEITKNEASAEKEKAYADYLRGAKTEETRAKANRSVDINKVQSLAGKSVSGLILGPPPFQDIPDPKEKDDFLHNRLVTMTTDATAATSQNGVTPDVTQVRNRAFELAKKADYALRKQADAAATNLFSGGKLTDAGRTALEQQGYDPSSIASPNDFKRQFRERNFDAMAQQVAGALPSETPKADADQQPAAKSLGSPMPAKVSQTPNRPTSDIDKMDTWQLEDLVSKGRPILFGKGEYDAAAARLNGMIEQGYYRPKNPGKLPLTTQAIEALRK